MHLSKWINCLYKSISNKFIKSYGIKKHYLLSNFYCTLVSCSCTCCSNSFLPWINYSNAIHSAIDFKYRRATFGLKGRFATLPSTGVCFADSRVSKKKLLGLCLVDSRTRSALKFAVRTQGHEVLLGCEAPQGR